MFLSFCIMVELMWVARFTVKLYGCFLEQVLSKIFFLFLEMTLDSFLVQLLTSLIVLPLLMCLLLGWQVSTNFGLVVLVYNLATFMLAPPAFVESLMALPFQATTKLIVPMLLQMLVLSRRTPAIVLLVAFLLRLCLTEIVELLWVARVATKMYVSPLELVLFVMCLLIFEMTLDMFLVQVLTKLTVLPHMMRLLLRRWVSAIFALVILVCNPYTFMLAPPFVAESLTTPTAKAATNLTLLMLLQILVLARQTNAIVSLVALLLTLSLLMTSPNSLFLRLGCAYMWRACPHSLNLLYAVVSGSMLKVGLPALPSVFRPPALGLPISSEH